jgi:hypothetical protein
MDFPEERPSIIARTITFIYTGDYSQTLLKQEGQGSKEEIPLVLRQVEELEDPFALVEEDNVVLKLRLHASMYAAGEKFILKELKELSLRKFCKCFSEYCQTENNICCMHWDNHADIITTEVAEAVYNTTPETDRELRDIFLTLFLRETMNSGGYHHLHLSLSRFKNLIIAVPELAYDVLANTLRFLQYRCTICKNQKMWILERRCKCGHEFYHSYECDAKDEKRRRCPQCGNRGCVERAFDDESDEDEENKRCPRCGGMICIAELINRGNGTENDPGKALGWDDSSAW